MAFQIVSCPHCAINGVSDGLCHNSPYVQQGTGVNVSCEECVNAARKRDEYHGNWFIGYPAFVKCHVCYGMRSVMIDVGTGEIKRLKVVS